jgi:S1-C subfamily serine protease
VHGSASRAGIQQDDIVMAVGDRAVHSLLDFDAALASTAADRPIPLLVFRDGSLGFLAVQPFR